VGRHFKRSGISRNAWYDGKHKFEHWKRDRSVYFITARVRDKLPVFQTPEVCAIFWEKFERFSSQHGFDPWIASLLLTHYHFVGFLQKGAELGEMMRKLHGSVAWLVCKQLNIQHKPFWRDDEHNDYFDGCLRDENQLTRTYCYTHTQAVRAGLVNRPEEYPNTKVYRSLADCLLIAREQNALMMDVPYARYTDPMRKRGKRRS
jgi:hypothetical protein